MTLHEIKDFLNAHTLGSDAGMQMNVEKVYCADLMSDVLAFSATNSLLITGLTNSQVVRTADVAGIKAIVFIQGKKPDAVTIALAEEKKVPLLATDFSMFDTCGKLYTEGLRG